VTANPERGGDHPERLQTCDGERVELRQVRQETWVDDLQTLLGLYRKALEKYVLHTCLGLHS